MKTLCLILQTGDLDASYVILMSVSINKEIVLLYCLLGFGIQTQSHIRQEGELVLIIEMIEPCYILTP